MSIRGVIFDFGGVINNMRWDVARELEEQHGLERSTIVRTLYDSDDWRQAQIGLADPLVYVEAAHQRLEEEKAIAYKARLHRLARLDGMYNQFRILPRHAGQWAARLM